MEITEKQKEYVLTHYGIVDTKIIALHLNTTPEYVKTIANRYGIKIKRQWTKEDMNYLRENWGETSLNRIRGPHNYILNSMDIINSSKHIWILLFR